MLLGESLTLNEMQSDLYRSRDEMLRILDMTAVEEIKRLFSDFSICNFLVIPREERMFFSDGMRRILGSLASQDVLLSSYLQFIPDSEREEVGEKYQNAFKDLVFSNVDHISIAHSLRKNQFENVEVEACMQLIHVDKENYIFGVLVDRTRTMRDRIACQLFSSGINDYIFSYDVINDVLYVNEKFMEDFDIPDWKVKNASNEIYRFVHQDDVDRLREAVSQFIHHKSRDFDGDFRFLSANSGEVHLHANGLSDADKDGVPGADPQYISGSFSDITSFVEDESIRTNLIEGTSAITFYADYRIGKIVFSENIHEILPGIPTEQDGELIELIATKIVPEDRKRFRDIMHQAC